MEITQNICKTLKRMKIYKNCIKKSKMNKSNKTSKTRKNLTSEWNQNYTSSHMLLDHCYAFGLLLEI